MQPLPQIAAYAPGPQRGRPGLAVYERATVSFNRRCHHRATGDATVVGTLAEVGRAEIPVPLADAVIWLFAFLEFGSDEVVDPDAAVTAMENAADDLLKLTRAEREALVERAQELADVERRPKVATFLRGFGEAGGLLDERPRPPQ
ncbi:MAG TPA: hypothetical protein VK988_21080 [Acidimicrobiales bacterium]|nr:hypothetical protein [Acidimicrobiales bacterium]